MSAGPSISGNHLEHHEYLTGDWNLPDNETSTTSTDVVHYQECKSIMNLSTDKTQIQTP